MERLVRIAKFNAHHDGKPTSAPTMRAADDGQPHAGIG
jgi:hypothetical protein